MAIKVKRVVVEFKLIFKINLLKAEEHLSLIYFRSIAYIYGEIDLNNRALGMASL